MLTSSLSGCAPAKLAPTLAVRATNEAPATRRAEIKRKLAPICPQPLSDAALDRAADYAESHPDKDALAIVNDLSRLDAEARVCRGMQIKG
jgi:hypothetical protein